MIHYYEDRQTFHLTTQSTSYVMALADGVWLGHLYYGAKLHDTAGMEQAFRLNEFPFSPAVNERDKVRFMQMFPFEYSFLGTGDYREPCLSVENAHGMTGVELTYRSHEILPGKVVPDGLPHTRGCGECCDTLDVLLEDRVLGLEVHLLYTVYKDLDAIVKSVRVVNRGDEPVVLKRVLSGQLNLDPDRCDVLTLHGSWGRERTITRQSLKTGAVSAESLRGVSSAEDDNRRGMGDEPGLLRQLPGKSPDRPDWAPSLRHGHPSGELCLADDTRGGIPVAGGLPGLFERGTRQNDQDLP